MDILLSPWALAHASINKETETEGEEGRERKSSFLKILFNVVVYIILITCI